ncbi:hypothetical protein HAX44_13215 [Enterococcus faecalis]|uniref:hypothetical protein n=1 Tax=Enterococcus faecalis TaxID=1351 RepID=UPI001883BB8B|nr:hypothetical protein [Enterococcus faecalis]MBF0006570.1 hypothetical protein [Enterococcus faecalis]MBF0009253.1 hypothetical protein [Enterococcus faecalis]MBF0018434.1 hypothetical protein [Enterococcus faecalis]
MEERERALAEETYFSQKRELEEQELILEEQNRVFRHSSENLYEELRQLMRPEDGAEARETFNKMRRVLDNSQEDAALVRRSALRELEDQSEEIRKSYYNKIKK